MLELALSEIARLKAQINKDSSNSSKPPSQNGLKKIKNSREKSELKRGGQPGHPGKSLEVLDNEKIEKWVRSGQAEFEVVDHTGGHMDVLCDFRDELDIKTTLVIRRHVYPLGEIPAEKRNKMTYGNGIKTLVSCMSVDSNVSMERISELVSQLSHGHIKLTDASILKFLCDLARKLRPEMKIIVTDLENGDVLHVDDTTVDATQKPDYSSDKVEMIEASNTSHSVCLRAYCNERSTLFTANPQKDMLGCDRDGILTSYFGILVHDHEAKFYNYGSEHATCNAHLLRELKGIAEQGIPWGAEMAELLRAMNRHKKDSETDEKRCSPDVLANFEKQFDDLMVRGRATLASLREFAPGRDELRKMLLRLTEYKDCYLLFLRDYRAPFTNNLAERDLRPIKTKLKVSGCFRSWEGLDAYATIRSFFSTLRKRSCNIFDALHKVYQAIPVLGACDEAESIRLS
jgi:transposase